MKPETLATLYICTRLITTIASSGLTVSFLARWFYGANISKNWVIGLFATSIIGSALCAELKVLGAAR